MKEDLVCGMKVISPSQFFVERNGERYEFCSDNCKTKFINDPEKYLVQPKEKQAATYSINSNGEEKIDIPIVGIHCSSCIPTIESEIKKLPGINFASVNIATEKAHIEFNNSEVKTGDIISAIKKAGYRTGQATLNLGIVGMHDASCVAKIESGLKTTRGVLSASVDIGAGTAIVKYIPGTVNVDNIKNEIKKLGYDTFDTSGVKPDKLKDSKIGEEEVDENQVAREKEYKTLIKKFIFAAALAVPVVFFSYPAVWNLPDQFQRGTETLKLIWIAMSILSLPVMFWSGSQFYKGAWAAFKNRSANMHTLIKIGRASCRERV